MSSSPPSLAAGSPSMRAAVLAGPTRIQVQQVARPEPGQGQVRVRLEGCGVCGSNLPPWEGRPWFQYPFAPGQPGHEGWGVVDALGPGITSPRPGDRVAVLAYHSFAEFDIAPVENVALLPATNRGPFPGEAVGCAWNVFARSGIASGHTVAMVGVGFLGALLTQLAAKSGARVFAISRRPIALEFARRFGAEQAIVWSDANDVRKQAQVFSNGQGFDCVIEAVGSQNALDLATDLTRERGRLVIAGYHQDGPRQVNMQLWNWRGLDVINAHERETRVYMDGIRAAVQAVSSGQLDIASLVTHRFDLDQISCGFENLVQRPGDFMKAVVTL